MKNTKKISILLSIILCSSLTAFLLIKNTPKDTNDVPNITATRDFVYTDGTKFMLNGIPYYYSGTNCYYLGYMSNFMVDNVFEDMVAMNLKVCRTWGFIDVGTLNTDGTLSNNADGEGHKAGVYYHYWDPDTESPAVNNGTNGLQKLDYVISSASKYGIKLIIPFVNYWKDMGGMDQYCLWVGLTNREDFYTNSVLKQYYKDYISTLLERTNVFTGIKYKDDPTIFAWELGNEPRNPDDTTGVTIVNWATEMSAYIKSIDSKHMVSIGDEGFYDDPVKTDYPYTAYEGTDWPSEIAISTIDFGTVHLYPDGWGMSSNTSWGGQWIIDHAYYSQMANKPMILEEFGWKDKSTRDTIYSNWFQIVEDYDVAGDNYWMLAGLLDDGVTAYADYDGFTVYWDASLSTQSTALIIQEHANIMEAKNVVIPDTEAPTTPTGLSLTVYSSKRINLEWIENPEIDLAKYQIYRSTTNGFTPSSSNLLAEVTTSYYSDSSVNSETTYYYRITAVDQSGNVSPNSAQVSGTTPEPDLVAPATPINLIATTISSSQISLNWDDNNESDFSRYAVYRSTISGFTPSISTLISESQTSEYLNSGLNDDTTYYYRITALDTSDNPSLPTSEVSAKTEKILPELRGRYYCGATDSTTAEIRPRFCIFNDGTLDAALTDIVLRYWFTSEPELSSLTFSCDYAAVGSSGITSSFVDAGDSDYLEIGFTSSANIPTWLGGDGTSNFMPIGSNTGDIQARVGRSSSVSFTQTNDYSFDSTIISYADFTKITVYYKGDLVWGVEPLNANTPPLLSQPVDISYIEGDTGNILSWTATDADPATYSITLDGTAYTSGSWISGTSITINVDGLTVGSHTITISILDQNGNSASDIVIVTVQESSEYALGDVNHDTSVDIIDALMIAQYYVGQNVNIDASLADVNLDNIIDIIDALLVAQYYVGTIPSLPA